MDEVIKELIAGVKELIDPKPLIIGLIAVFLLSAIVTFFVFLLN
jgi:hypothetical protein